MARGALVINATNVVLAVFDAASELNLQYCQDPGGTGWCSFIPDQLANPGDTWVPGSQTFTYTSVQAIVSAVQIRWALLAVGKRVAWEAVVTGGQQPLKDWWNFTHIFRRLDPTVTTIGTAAGMSSADLDAMFRQASLYQLDGSQSTQGPVIPGVN